MLLPLSAWVYLPGPSTGDAILCIYYAVEVDVSLLMWSSE
jgi:hypothetical protein